MAVSLEPKGSAFVRAAIAKALTDGQADEAADLAAARWGERSPAVAILKTAVSGGATGSGWGANLVSAEAAIAEFFGLVNQRTVLGRLAGLRRVPANVRLLQQLTGFGSGWVAPGAAVPIGAASFVATTLEPLKVAGAAVITEDLARNASPEAEALIRMDLIREMVEAIDTALLDPDNAGVANEKPRSVTNALATASPDARITPTGTIGDDLKALITDFDGDLTRAFFVCRPDYGAGLTSAAYPNIGARGGELLGVPVLTSRSAPDGLILLDPGRLAVVEDGGDVKVSRQGAVEMDDAPTGDATSPTATTLVSLWQANAVGISVLRRINWAAQNGAVSMLAAA